MVGPLETFVLEMFDPYHLEFGECIRIYFHSSLENKANKKDTAVLVYLLYQNKFFVHSANKINILLSDIDAYTRIGNLIRDFNLEHE
jgi:hypothetical protein